jgi:hypothetical protein
MNVYRIMSLLGGEIESGLMEHGCSGCSLIIKLEEALKSSYKP